MRFYHFLPVIFLLVLACSSNVRFIQTDESYTAQEKPNREQIVVKKGKIQRPHQVVGVIEAVLGKNARRPELDALIVKKAREIGADGVMLVEYDTNRDVYLERYHAVVGRGPYRRHVVGTRPRAVVRKTATALAVVFK